VKSSTQYYQPTCWHCRWHGNWSTDHITVY